MVDRGNGKANGASKPNGKARATNVAPGNGRAFFGREGNQKRVEAEAALVKFYVDSGMKALDAVRRLAKCVAPDPWQRKPGSRANGQ
jgi:hypothetical protein